MPTDHGRHRVLIVEDDPNIRNLIATFLEEEGYEILLAGNGQEGVDLARSERPSVILMDINLPILDGVRAIAILKHDPATSWMQIVAMSAGTTLVRHAEHLQADGMLGKPFDLDVLLAQVEMRATRVQPPTG